MKLSFGPCVRDHFVASVDSSMLQTVTVHVVTKVIMASIIEVLCNYM